MKFTTTFGLNKIHLRLLEDYEKFVDIKTDVYYCYLPSHLSKKDVVKI